MKQESEAYEGMWDYDGSCAPNRDGTGTAWHGQETFTLGLFQWVRRGRDGTGEGLKRGKVQERVKGYVGLAHEAYDKAEQICAERNESQGW